VPTLAVVYAEHSSKQVRPAGAATADNDKPIRSTAPNKIHVVVAMDHNQPGRERGHARCVRLERAVVLAVLACIVLLAVIGLGFYGLKSKTGWLRIQAGVWRLVTFSIEIGQGGDPTGDRPPREEQRELEAGRDQPRELEAGHGSSEQSAAADQNDAVA
jgi:hypothetical protein